MAKWSEERKQAARKRRASVVAAIRKTRENWLMYSQPPKVEGEIYIPDPFGPWAQKKAPLTDNERKAING
jgi:hypothetical protein